MAGHSQRPLTPAEAKERLRIAAEEVSVSNWVSRNPLGAVTAGLLGGIVLGSASNLRRTLSRSLITALPLLLRR